MVSHRRPDRLIWALLVRRIPEGPTRDILLILSGALVAIAKDVYGFEFGSSRGSEVKTEQLGRLMGSGSAKTYPSEMGWLCLWIIIWITLNYQIE
jgi:hypothetical protein